MLVRNLVLRIIAWSAYGKHEMPAAEMSDDVDCEVQAIAVGAREFRCGSNRQMFFGPYFSTSYGWHLRAIVKLAKQAISLNNIPCYVDKTNKCWWMEDARIHYLSSAERFVFMVTCNEYTTVDYSTWIFMRDCRENNRFFHKKLPLLTVQVWSNINCLGRISRSTALGRMQTY